MLCYISNILKCILNKYVSYTRHRLMMNKTQWLRLIQSRLLKLSDQNRCKTYFSHLFSKHKIHFWDPWFFFALFPFDYKEQHKKRGSYSIARCRVSGCFENNKHPHFFPRSFTWSEFCARLFCKMLRAVLLRISRKAPVQPEWLFFHRHGGRNIKSVLPRLGEVLL